VQFDTAKGQERRGGEPAVSGRLQGGGNHSWSGPAAPGRGTFPAAGQFRGTFGGGGGRVRRVGAWVGGNPGAWGAGRGGGLRGFKKLQRRHSGGGTGGHQGERGTEEGGGGGGRGGCTDRRGGEGAGGPRDTWGLWSNQPGFMAGPGHKPPTAARSGPARKTGPAGFFWLWPVRGDPGRAFSGTGQRPKGFSRGPGPRWPDKLGKGKWGRSRQPEGRQTVDAGHGWP